jgi:PhnB protein
LGKYYNRFIITTAARCSSPERIWLGKQEITMNKPPGFTTVFPYIFASDANTYIEFLREGLGGRIDSVLRSPDGIVLNAQIVFDDTTIMVSDAVGWSEPTHGTYYLYVDDADAAMARALTAGGELFSEVKNQVYGDRQGGVRDLSGNVWWISQRLQAGPY